MHKNVHISGWGNISLVDKHVQQPEKKNATPY